MSSVEKAEALEAELTSTLDRLQEADAAAAGLRCEHDAKSAALAKSEREVKKRQTLVIALEQQLDDKVGEVAALVGRMTERASENDRLAAEYQKMRAACDERKRECAELTSSLESRGRQLREKDSEYETIVLQVGFLFVTVML